MTIALADELVGAVRRGRGANARMVILNGWHELAERDSLVQQRAKRLKTRRKNAKAAAKRTRSPEQVAARAEYMRAWRESHPELMKNYRAAYRKTHAAWSRKYQREWKRARYVAKGGPRRGEANPTAKLTVAKVVEMRNLFETWRQEGRREGFRALGALYGVSFASARKIVRREMWAHA